MGSLSGGCREPNFISSYCYFWPVLPPRVATSINVHITCCAWAQGRRKQLKRIVLGNFPPLIGRCLDLRHPRLPLGAPISILWASYYHYHPALALLPSGFRKRAPRAQVYQQESGGRSQQTQVPYNPTGWVIQGQSLGD